MLSGLKILLVEDESDIRDLTELLLTLYHANVIATASAFEGLIQFQKHRPDVIVSDIGMPKMNGYQFIRLVRYLPALEGGQTPAVALAAHNLGADRAQALYAGFQRHLTKPYDLQELIDIIADMAINKPHCNLSTCQNPSPK